MRCVMVIGQHVPGLDLRRHEIARRRARPRTALGAHPRRRIPGRGMEARLHALRHERVIGRMELDHVDPEAVGVEASSGSAGSRWRGGRASNIAAVPQRRAERRQRRSHRHRAIGRESAREAGRSLVVQVDVDERRRLVEDLVGIQGRSCSVMADFSAPHSSWHPLRHSGREAIAGMTVIGHAALARPQLRL